MPHLRLSRLACRTIRPGETSRTTRPLVSGRSFPFQSWRQQLTLRRIPSRSVPRAPAPDSLRSAVSPGRPAPTSRTTETRHPCSPFASTADYERSCSVGSVANLVPPATVSFAPRVFLANPTPERSCPADFAYSSDASDATAVHEERGSFPNRVDGWSAVVVGRSVIAETRARETSAEAVSGRRREIGDAIDVLLMDRSNAMSERTGEFSMI